MKTSLIMPVRVLLATSLLSPAVLLLLPTYGYYVEDVPSPPLEHSSYRSSLVLRIPFEDREDLRNLTARLDVWEVHYEENKETGGGREGERDDAGYVVALVGPVERSRLEAEGRAEIGAGMSVDPRSYHPDTIPDYPCYRTIDELYTHLQTIHAAHTDITELIDIGDSFQGRDVWVVRITSRAVTAPKPVLFIMANIHGRELITNEAAMAFVDYLTGNYGVDPDVTWLVDHHEIHVSVSTNPDGHVKNEAGQPWAWWRKNANSNFCTGGLEGVDLNRNSSFLWNCCGGSSDDECRETYHGPSAASEVETQAVEGYVRAIFPNQRAASLDAAAPLTATGVFLTLHSYGNLVLWPWGHTDAPAPNEAGLAALGRNMAARNGYTPQQAAYLYPVDGATDDWAYGELGVAAYTFEIGGDADGFYPPCERYGALVQPNIAAFLYAAKVARTPYLTAHGPDTLDVSVGPASVLSGGSLSVTVSATIDDAGSGGAGVAGAEFYLDAPPWAGGTPAPMSPVDGVFGGVSESVVAMLDTSTLPPSPNRHIVFVRGRDADGYWGPFTAAWLDATTFASFASSSPDWLGQATAFTVTLAGAAPVTYTWDLGDGLPLASGPSPTHTYGAPGVYTVVLTATHADGSAVMPAATIGVVTVYGPPAAGFLLPNPVLAGRSTTFINTTQGNPAGDPAITYAWSFGDGSLLSTAPHPTHVYTTPGTRTVTLTATNPAGCDAHSADVEVRVPQRVYLPLVVRGRP